MAPENALMVGDSLTGDIAAANSAGMDACRYIPTGKTAPESINIKYIPISATRQHARSPNDWRYPPMAAVIRKNLNLKLDMRAVMQKLRVPDDLEDEFAEIFAECARSADPGYMYAEVPVRQTEETTIVGHAEFDSRIMLKNFRGLDRVWPYVMTCGKNLYNLAKLKSDPLESYWVDSIAEQYLGAIHPVMHAEVSAIAGVDRLYAMNPGSLEDFPLACQRPLFDMLGDVEAGIGAWLTDSFLILPYKSGSGIYFTSDSHYENCAMCPRTDCPNRRAPYDGMLFQTKYA